jgi:hypothetical protein
MSVRAPPLAGCTPLHSTATLRPGSFYVSREGSLWCCYSVDPEREEQCKALCVRVSDGHVEYFYLNGRYDTDGKREHTLTHFVCVLMAKGSPRRTG